MKIRKFLAGMFFGQNSFAWWVQAWVGLIESIIEILTFTIITPDFHIRWARLRIYMRCEENITNKDIKNWFKSLIFRK